MTEKTVTSTTVQNRKIVHHEGVNAAYTVFNFKERHETASVTLVLQMIPLPDRSRILDLWVAGGVAPADGAYVVGDASLTNRFITSTSLATTVFTRLNARGGFGHKVSLSTSGTRENLPYTVQLSLNSGTPTASTSYCIGMCVYYIIEND